MAPPLAPTCPRRRGRPPANVPMSAPGPVSGHPIHRGSRRTATLALLAGLLGLAACGGGGDGGAGPGANAPPSDPTALVPAPATLRGVWRTVSLDGAYEMTIEPTMVHIAGPLRVQSGAISVEGQRIWFFRAPDGSCGGGWYAWSIDGQSLRLENQSDNCSHRVTILGWAPWTRGS